MTDTVTDNLFPIDAIPVTSQKSTLPMDVQQYVPFPVGKLNYSHFSKASRPYTAVVSLSRTQGAFTNLQEAINYVHNLGGGSIFIRSGTYVINTSITLYSNIYLIGEDKINTILNLGGHYLSANQTGAYIDGTISATNGSKIITGNGTLWVGRLLANDIIYIQGAEWVIASVDSDTQLTLVDTYNGIGFSGFSYFAGTFYQNIQISKITINTGSIYFNQVRDFVLHEVECNGKSSWFGYATSGVIENCSFKNSDTYGVLTAAMHNVVFDYCRAINNALAGYYIQSAGGQGVVFRDCLSISNGNSGFALAGVASMINCLAMLNAASGIFLTSGFSGESNIVNNISAYNGTNGIRLNTSYNSGSPFVGNNTFGNNTAGFRIDVANVRDVPIVGNSFVDGIIIDPGTKTVIKNNMGDTSITEMDIKKMKNNSGGQLTIGQICIIDNSVAAGDNITTTTTAGSNLVYGMVLETINNGAYGRIQIKGKTVYLKVNGTTAIAIGDYISCYTSAGIGQKATAGQTVIAIALEAYSTADSNGIIDALIIPPRLI